MFLETIKAIKQCGKTYEMLIQKSENKNINSKRLIGFELHNHNHLVFYTFSKYLICCQTLRSVCKSPDFSSEGFKENLWVALPQREASPPHLIFWWNENIWLWKRRGESGGISLGSRWSRRGEAPELEHKAAASQCGAGRPATRRVVSKNKCSLCCIRMKL